MTEFQEAWWGECKRFAPSVFCGLFLAVSTLTAHGYVTVSAALLIALAVLLLWFLKLQQAPVSDSVMKVVLGCFAVACLAYALSSWQVNQQRSNWLPSDLEGIELMVVGVIQSLPVNRNGTLKLELRLSHRTATEFAQVQVATATEPVFVGDGVLALNCYQCEQTFGPGETWRMLVKLKRPHGYASWGAFDYEKFLFRKSVIATGYVRQPERAHKLATPSWRYAAESLRSHVLKRFVAAHGSPSLFYQQDQAQSLVGLNMMLALAIGYKAGFSNDNRQVFQQTGIAHLMVISGLHIGLLFALTSLLLSGCINRVPPIMNRYVRQHLVLIPALLVAALYAALAGFSIPTQRALLMLTIYAALRFFGRDAHLLQILLVTAVIVVMLDPLAVLDVGFWMSFSAVFTIGLWQVASRRNSDAASPPEWPRTRSGEREFDELGLPAALTPQEPRSIKRRLYDGLLQLFKLQLCLVVALIPLGSHFFGQVSIAALLVNLVAIPLFSVLIIPLTLALATLLSIWPESVTVSAAISLVQLGLWFVYQSLDVIASWPISSLALPKTPLWVALPLLIVAGVLLIQRQLWLMFLLVAVFLVMAWVWPTKSLQRPVISLLDIGQGLTMVVRYQTKTLVYDVGPRYRTGFNTAEAVLLPYLTERGIRFVDTLIISHADNDHIGGYEVFADRMAIGSTFTGRVDVLTGALPCEDQPPWQWGELQFAIISPTTDTPAGSNNRSCVLRIAYADVAVLITGDIEKAVERFLVQRNSELTADILLVPHHGSKTSSTDVFIDAVEPQLGLIAAGYRNQYRHPHPEVVRRYLDRGIPLLQTPLEGTVEITLTRGAWTIKGFRQAHPKPWHAVTLQTRTLGG